MQRAVALTAPGSPVGASCPRPVGGSCSWPEARSGIQRHWKVAGPPPSNIGAWLSIDESGVTVTAQWPGVSGEWAEYAVPAFMAGTINVAMELHCLHPQPDLLVLLVVDDAGMVEIVGVWPGEAMRTEDLSQLRYCQLENWQKKAVSSQGNNGQFDRQRGVGNPPIPDEHSQQQVEQPAQGESPPLAGSPRTSALATRNSSR